MLKVALIQMPWVTETFPSLGLTQIKAVLKRRFGSRVQADIFYLNHDVAAFLGMERYAAVSRTPDSIWSAVGDWLFRQAAFPELPDNSQRYVREFYRLAEGDDPEAVRRRMLPWTRQLSAFLDTLIDRYRLDSYHVAGFTTLLMQNNASFAMARKLKQRRSDLITVVGGPHAISVMGQAIARNVWAVDFVFSGPALISFPQFVEHLLEGRPEKCHDMHAVFSKRRLARYPDERIATEEIGPHLDINADLELDFDDFLTQLDQKLPEPRVSVRLPFETSRGCWWGQKSQCLFCGTAGNAMCYHAMEPALAIKHIQNLYRYAPRVSKLHGNDMVMPRNYLTQVLPYLKPPPHLPILYEVRAELSEADLRQMTAAGVTVTGPGIEALNTATLRLMRKGTTAFMNLQFLKACVRVGISPHWNLILGLPGMGEEVYRKYAQDIPKLLHLPAPGAVLPVKILRFSPLFSEAAALGLDIKPADFYREIYPFPPREIEDIAYVFEDRDPRAPHLLLVEKWLLPLRSAGCAWMHRWDSGQRPQLTLRESHGQWQVFDTRSAQPATYDLSPLEYRILCALEQPLSLAALAGALPEHSPQEVEQGLRRLDERNLLFDEGEKYLSLVILPSAQRLARRPVDATEAVNDAAGRDVGEAMAAAGV